jgi:hypothetical protein
LLAPNPTPLAPTQTLPVIYSERLKQIKQQEALHHYGSAINQYGTLIELALEHFYKDVWACLSPDEKQTLITPERQFTHKNPTTSLYLGTWLDFYKKTNMPNILAKTHSLDPAIFDFAGLFAVNELRNKCTHDQYLPTPQEMQRVESFTDSFLLSLKLVDHIPTIFPADNISDERTSAMIDLTRQVRMVLSANPSIVYSDVLSDEPGMSYEIDVNWEFMGGFYDETMERVTLMMLEGPSTFHPDISDVVYQRLQDEIAGRLKETIALAKSRGLTGTFLILVNTTPPEYSPSADMEFKF